MQTEAQVSLDCQAVPHPENNVIKDGDPGALPSSPNHVAPKPVKRQTRQWAAWTRQEEESFFTALRQVGKNFEKITCRVQSKNKDQVRHYYYRLVRRMNKLLGPGFSLDAKNSKDTNAAMLRWWSLLEKYSCKASKLHLKPRRFKIFIEALEHQLLKDRKKNIRKRPSQGGNCSSTAPNTVSSQSRASGNETRAVKLVLVESQNVQKLGPGKGSSLKRNVNVGVNRSNSKGDSSAMKTARQRQKPAAAVSSAAYKRWEKAAIAGVSLVADAAEHLERTTNDKEVEHDQSAPGQRGFDAVGEVLPPVPTFSQNMFVKSNVQTSTKLKLQLFPIDEGTRRALEMDKHNPHLELTLSTRKKISSVLEHLTRKWGNSGIASGELMLFPYSVQRGNLAGHPRWTQDSSVTAADVYEIIGSPPVFRLRYGWFSNTEISSVAFQAPLASCTILGEHNMEVNNRKKQIMDSRPIHAPPPTDHQSEKLVEPCKDRSTLLTGNTVVPSSNNAQEEMTRYVNVASNSNLMESSEAAANISWHQRESEDDSIMMPLEEVDDLRISSSTALSTGEWADSLTNISVGDLLADVSQEMDTSCVNPPVSGSSQYPQQIPFSCDSFDAAIAAHISKHQDKTSFQSALVSHAPSIWDAEETCDGFSFQKNPVFHQEVLSSSKIASPGASEQIARINSVGSGCLIEELPNVERLLDDPAHGDLMDDSPSDPHMLDSTAKDLSGLADIYWPDSLGPLDLDIPSSRYHNEDLILSESLSGLKSLIANSVDAFQNCSFFGLDKKEAASTVEARETVSFADFKIGSGV
ncbi:TSL-kinase interacting protein 1 isoform X1 [Vitis riparia]|uniref:TSL-kinase interacting protein 1 isoform X1 n=1 Tax=Vitis riparia TaxID=96939 RepID=UPI00155AD9F0|nr:TSL-kinase interacting protein 1 isoform X1 [Vitis riparia]XP_034693730.1 TSL-kinase interacting protein 1 isoform X1 [Vitis riparia]